MLISKYVLVFKYQYFQCYGFPFQHFENVYNWTVSSGWLLLLSLSIRSYQKNLRKSGIWPILYHLNIYNKIHVSSRAWHYLSSIFNKYLSKCSNMGSKTAIFMSHRFVFLYLAVLFYLCLYYKEMCFFVFWMIFWIKEL